MRRYESRDIREIILVFIIRYSSEYCDALRVPTFAAISDDPEWLVTRFCNELRRREFCIIKLEAKLASSKVEKRGEFFN